MHPLADDTCGAIAQLGERYNGIVEVVGSKPSGSTNQIKGLRNFMRSHSDSGVRMECTRLSVPPVPLMDGDEPCLNQTNQSALSSVPMIQMEPNIFSTAFSLW